MDVQITTTDPDEVDAEDVASALIGGPNADGEGWYVHSVTIRDRRGDEHQTWHDTGCDCRELS